MAVLFNQIELSAHIVFFFFSESFGFFKHMSMPMIYEYFNVILVKINTTKKGNSICHIYIYDMTAVKCVEYVNFTF